MMARHKAIADILFLLKDSITTLIKNSAPPSISLDIAELYKSIVYHISNIINYVMATKSGNYWLR